MPALSSLPLYGVSDRSHVAGSNMLVFFYIVQLDIWIWTAVSHRFIEAKHKDYVMCVSEPLPLRLRTRAGRAAPPIPHHPALGASSAADRPMPRLPRACINAGCTGTT